MTEFTEQQAKQVTAALSINKAKLPAGFAFRVKQKILRERLRLAERSTRRQALFTAIGFAVLALIAVQLLNTFDLSEAEWFGTVPFELMSWMFLGALFLAGLDRLLDASVRTIQTSK